MLIGFQNFIHNVAFNSRIINLAYVSHLLSESLMKEVIPKDSSDKFSLLDSIPIITCSGKRQGKVANQITNKSYCSTENLYYHGVICML